MPFGLLFWILMLLWLVLEFTPVIRTHPYGPYGSNLLLFILLLLLGWHDFGPPIRG